MLHKTRGVVFKTIDYSESSVVVQVLTEKFGIQSYLVNGVKRPGARIRQNILQPLYLLDMVVYHKPSGNLQRAAEIRHLPVFMTIPYDLVKSSLVLFLDEVLYRSIRQQNTDEILFNYIFHSIELLDRLERGVSCFHLVFLMRLTQFLGFFPASPAIAATPEYFDLQAGHYTNYAPLHSSVLHQPHTSYWKTLSESGFENLQGLQIPADVRKILLRKLLEYYRFHIDGFGEVKSLGVLEDVW